MREVNVKVISDALRDMAIEANCVLGDHEIEYFKKMAASEESPTGKEIFDLMLENLRGR
jgi:tartrate dehydratase alpha subunit/fumarate hydratase class I-like protein